MRRPSGRPRPARNKEPAPDLEKLRADMTWRMVLIMGTMLGLFAALDRFFLN